MADNQDSKKSIPKGPKASTDSTIKRQAKPGQSNPGDFGVAPKQMTFPAATQAQIANQNTPGAAGNPKGRSQNNVQSLTDGMGNLSTGPREKDDGDRVRVEAMTPRTKHALVVADPKATASPDRRLQVRGLPDYGPNSQFPPQPADPKARPKVVNGVVQPLIPLAIAYDGVPAKLLFAYFDLAWYVGRGQERNYWNLMHNMAEDVNHLVAWAIKDASSPTSIEVDLSGLSAARIVRLWATIMSMVNRRALKSIETQFSVLVEYCTLTETLAAWEAANEWNVKGAFQLTNHRLHGFAWGRLGTSRALPFDDIEMLFNAQPKANFTISAMRRLAHFCANRDITRDSQFQAMSRDAQTAFLALWYESRDARQRNVTRNVTEAATTNEQNYAPPLQVDRAWQNDAPTRGALPTQPERYTTIGADPYGLYPSHATRGGSGGNVGGSKGASFQVDNNKPARGARGKSLGASDSTTQQ